MLINNYKYSAWVWFKIFSLMPMRCLRVKDVNTQECVGKPQKQYTVQRTICISKTGKIWYGLGTVPSGIINTFQPLRCSHIMLWQASTPPGRLLIFTHTQYIHIIHKPVRLSSLLYVPGFAQTTNLLLNHLRLIRYATVMYHLRRCRFVLRACWIKLSVPVCKTCFVALPEIFKRRRSFT